MVLFRLLNLAEQTLTNGLLTPPPQSENDSLFVQSIITFYLLFSKTIDKCDLGLVLEEKCGTTQTEWWPMNKCVVDSDVIFAGPDRI